MRFDRHFIEQTLVHATLLYDVFPEHLNFSVDSRTLTPGDIFVACPGERYDGHAFVKQACEKGAAGLIVRTQHALEGISTAVLEKMFVLIVPDVLDALKQLARAWRAQFSYPVLALTGSVGKTSTKQMIAHVLQAAGMSALVTKGNQNSILGVCMNVLRMRHDHAVAVFECGISARGEMKQLVDIIRPTIGLITCVGHSHMAGVGSLLDVAVEKRDIFAFFKEDNIGIINGDQTILARIGYIHPVVKFGSKTTNQIQARKVRIGGTQTTFVLKMYREKFDITLKSNHEGMVFNALAAAAVGCMLNIPKEHIVAGIQVPVQLPGRFEYKQLAQGTIIDDCYNASPESTKASLLAFEAVKTDSQKVVVFGDMRELGVESPFWHRQVGRFMRKITSIDHVVLVGDLVRWTKEAMPAGITCDLVSTWQDAVPLLEKYLTQDAVVLVKGSTRGHTQGLAELVNHFTQPAVSTGGFKSAARVRGSLSA